MDLPPKVYKAGDGPKVAHMASNRLLVFSLNERIQKLLEKSSFPDLLASTLSGELHTLKQESPYAEDSLFYVYALNDEEETWYKMSFDENWMTELPAKLQIDVDAEAFRISYIAGVGVSMHIMPWLSACARGTKSKFLFQDMVDVVNAFQPMSLVSRRTFSKAMFTGYALSLLQALDDPLPVKGRPIDKKEKGYLTGVKSWVDVFNPKRELVKHL